MGLFFLYDYLSTISCAEHRRCAEDGSIPVVDDGAQGTQHLLRSVGSMHTGSVAELILHASMARSVPDTLAPGTTRARWGCP
jgi:hypothetical protein